MRNTDQNAPTKKKDRSQSRKQFHGGQLPRIVLATVLSIFCFSIIGCATEVPPDFPIIEPEVILGPGDQLDIIFPEAPELDTQQVAQVDGNISLNYVGQVNVSGLTVDELQAKLVELYSVELIDPQITVVPRFLYAQQVGIVGEVAEPGLIPIVGTTTLLQAISQVGGLNETGARSQHIYVIRHLGGQRFTKELDMKEVLKEPWETDPFYLAAGDIVYIPRKRIVRFNEWIDQYINNILPDVVGDFFTFQVLRRR